MFDGACDAAANAIGVASARGEAADARGEADALANGEEGANELSDKFEKLKDSPSETLLLSPLLSCFCRNKSLVLAKSFGNLNGWMMYNAGCAL